MDDKREARREHRRQPNPAPDTSPSVCPYCKQRFRRQAELVVHLVNGPHGGWSPRPPSARD